MVPCRCTQAQTKAGCPGGENDGFVGDPRRTAAVAVFGYVRADRGFPDHGSDTARRHRLHQDRGVHVGSRERFRPLHWRASAMPQRASSWIYETRPAACWKSDQPLPPRCHRPRHLVILETKGKKIEPIAVTPDAPISYPISLLINGGTANTAELLAAALQAKGQDLIGARRSAMRAMSS